ncbi:MAG: galactokinase [Anaerolineales bacterium]|nr:galactokinase [Anaerolineales bacterium]
MDLKNLSLSFESHFNAEAQAFVRAPGRVNLIGEHTDYNGGFVLPMAIDREIRIALRPRDDGIVRLFSLDFEAESAFEIASLTRTGGWAEYAKGITAQLLQAGVALKGFDATLSGDIPVGAGLSSSAALELALARAFCVASSFNWDALQMAKLAQQAENEWVGVQCGIMDQMASAVCQANRALFLDCRSLEFQHILLPKGISVVVMDTTTRRGLADSAYNERRSECEEAARWLGVSSLRDTNVKNLNKWKAGCGLSESAFKRARHVITENQRALSAVKALKTENVNYLGELFNASHASLRDDFEVSNDALNHIVECAQAHSACYGARMTGAGFGGCAVALVEEEKVEAFAQSVSEAYCQKSGLAAALYVCRASAGASLLHQE